MANAIETEALSPVNRIETSVLKPNFQIVDRVEKVNISPVISLNTRIFNLSQALNGASIGFMLNGELVPVLNFQPTGNNNNEDEQYTGTAGGTAYYFNRLGGCSDKDPNHVLQMLDAQIPVKRDTVATRGDSDSTESIEISSLQPREQFALAAMQSIIGKLDFPILLLDEYKISQIAMLSFNVANAMMNYSAEYRAETKQVENPPETVGVNGETLTTNTEKILFNLTTHIEGLKKMVEKLNTTITDQGKEARKIEVSKISATEALKVSGSVEVSKLPNVTIGSMPAVSINGTPNVSVANIPSVNINNTPSVSISGTPSVSVNNTPYVRVSGTVPVNGTVDVGNAVDVNVISMPTSSNE